MRRLSSLLTIGLIIFGIIWFYQFYVGSIQYSQNPGGENRIIVDVKSGDTATDVANTLYRKGLIKSKTAFKVYLKQQDAANQIKAGRIVVSGDSTMPEIVQALLDGKTQEMSITLLEGWTAEQMARKIEETELITADEFLNCVKNCQFDHDFIPESYLEGYLYPDTYFVDPANFNTEQFISRLLNTFQSRLSDDDVATIQKNGRTLEDIVIMASIVEREERNEKERPTVAGILWNRFDANVGLGADATVLYGLGRTEGGLTYEDLQLDSPFNTRKYRGLPPTPISNPSISSIRAAIHPKETNYWYYLHGSDGQIHYATTLEGHNVNKAKYIR